MLEVTGKVWRLKSEADELNLTTLNSSSEHVCSNGNVHTGSRRTELTYTKLTQLHDALLAKRVSVTKLIGYSSVTVRELQFSSVQFSSSAVNTALYVFGTKP